MSLVYGLERYNYTTSIETDREYLAKLPLNASITVDSGMDAVVVHGSPSNPLYGYLYHWLPEERVEVMIKASARLTLRPASTRKSLKGKTVNT